MQRQLSTRLAEPTARNSREDAEVAAADTWDDGYGLLPAAPAVSLSSATAEAKVPALHKVADAADRPRPGRRKVTPSVASAEDVAVWLATAFPKHYHVEGRAIAFVPCYLVGHSLAHAGELLEDKTGKLSLAQTPHKNGRYSLASSAHSADDRGDVEILADNTSGSDAGSRGSLDSGSLDEDVPLDLPAWLQARGLSDSRPRGSTPRKLRALARDPPSSDDGFSDVSIDLGKCGASSGGFSDVSSTGGAPAPGVPVVPISVTAAAEPAWLSADRPAAKTSDAASDSSAFSDVSAPSRSGRKYPEGYRSREERATLLVLKKAMTWPALGQAPAAKAQAEAVKAFDSDSGGFSDVSEV